MSAVPVLVALAVLAVVGVTAVTRWPATGAEAARYVTMFALVASALLPFLVLSGEVGGPPASSAGSAGSGAGGSPTGSLPTLAVVASVVAVGLLTALVWPYLVTIGRRAPRILTAASSTRTIARRRPLLPMVTAGFLAASCCLLVFTAGYRESLRQSGEDQAAYRVPLDVSVAASARIAAPLEALDGDRLREVAPGTVVRPVVTSAVTAFGGTPRALVLPLTGVDPGGADRDARVPVGDRRLGDGRRARSATECGSAARSRRAGHSRRRAANHSRRAGLQRRHHAGAVAQHRRRTAAAGALRRLGSGADRGAARRRGTHRARSGDRGVGDPAHPA